MKITNWIVGSMLLFSSAVMANALDSTDLRLYRPFEAVEAQATPSSQQFLQGECNLPSQLEHRNDAWSCRVKEQQYDPCFVKTYVERQQLICPEAPWSTKAVTIKLNQELLADNPKELDMSQDFPWAVQLLDGHRCLLVKNSNARVDGQAVHYKCSDNSVLVGEIQRCKAVWKTLHVLDNNQELTLVDIAVAWF